MTNEDQSDKIIKKDKQFSEAISSYFDEPRDDDEKSFAELLNDFESDIKSDVQVGERVRGEIISIGMDTVFVNTGTKIDGSVDKAELLDKEKAFPYNVGDIIELFVVSVDENEIKLSKALSGVGGLTLLREAREKSMPVEGKVQEACKGGFIVDILTRRAFCPISQMDLKFVENQDDYIGKAYQFLISRLEENGKNIVVSRRELLQREQDAAKQEFLKEIGQGSVVNGRITRLTPYGAFVELFPGLEGMIHISEMSWSRLEKPEDFFKPDDVVQVKIINPVEADESGRYKIALSIKELTGDPWENEAQSFQAGQKLRGKVTRCAPFGAFVELTPGVEGLVHISEMSYKKRIVKPEEIAKPGDMVDVLIKDIDLDNRRISLSIRDAEGDPWIDVAEKYKIGSIVNGLVEKKESFGYFVSLEPGVTGLLPKSKIKDGGSPVEIEKAKEGASIAVIVDSINMEDRKISLSPGTKGEADDWRTYARSNQNEALGSLGDKLKEALNKKG